MDAWEHATEQFKIQFNFGDKFGRQFSVIIIYTVTG